MWHLFLQITITAALGFDSYLVMRHGAGPLVAMPNSSTKVEDMSTVVAQVNSSLTIDGDKGQRLGCYFCNDVVAPIDVCNSLDGVSSEDICLFDHSFLSSAVIGDLISVPKLYSLDAVNFQSHIGPAMYSDTTWTCANCFCTSSGTTGGNFTSSQQVNLKSFFRKMTYICV